MVFSDEDGKPHRYLRNQLGRTAHWVSLAAFMDSNRLYSLTPDLGYLKPLIKGDLVRRLHARYDESLRIGEDFNFLARIMANGHQLRIDPAAMYLYRKHGSSASYRMGARDIRAMLEADQRLYRQAALTPEEHRALLRRKRSLEAQLVYDGVVAAVKHGDTARGATMALAEPRIWPLLTRPLTARLKRLVHTLAHKAAAALPTGTPQGMA
jgi:succinoglycan biosynthesis protein ExoO